MNEIIRKLTSRKLWVAIAGIATGVAMIFGAEGSEIKDVAGAIMALCSAMTYLFVEGKIDAESVKNTLTLTGEGLEAIGFGEETEEDKANEPE